MHQHHGINYLETPCSQLEANEAFFATCSAGASTTTVAVTAASLAPSFFRAAHAFDCQRGCPLIVLY
ncbi:hypothetical protein ACF8C6_06165 [Pseudomonas sp. zbq_18]|uniref:hypothetical protein n=1 Tax=Pseudomonas sp. zbq_18 TaxID=3367251 RepID=UPI00370BC5EA